MKPSAVARCAVANEYLRRRKQPFGGATNRLCPEHHVELLSVTFETMPVKVPQTEQIPTESSRSSKLSTANEERSAETMWPGTVALDKISTAVTSRSEPHTDLMKGLETEADVGMTGHNRDSGVRRPALQRDRTSSAVRLALKLNASRSAPITPTVVEPDDQNASLDEPILSGCDTATQASQHMANHEYQVLTAFRFSASEDDCASKINVPSPHLKELSETASPTSDTTLFEDAPICSCCPSSCGEDIHAYTAHNNTLRKDMPDTCTIQVKERGPTPMARRYVRHRRYVSSDSAFDVAELPSTSLRSRIKTNDGLLLFRANSSKKPTTDFHDNRHRHRISLHLPVNPHASQCSGAQRPQQLDSKHWTQPLAGIEVVHPARRSNVWAVEERDLEYKHRHTFVGTGSLDDLLEILEISTTHTTTKRAVAGAFVQLASAEQLYARQCSTGKNGWDLVSRTSLTVMDVTSVDYVVQLQVKLGSITLRQFLDLIPFDGADEAPATCVVEAFSIASHMDATAGIGTSSKAKGFRSWLVEQMKADAGL